MTNVRISSVDTDIEELVDAGVVVCIAAGNRAHKIDVPGGTDFNNNAVTDDGTKYYHRGSSPYGDAGYDGGSTGIIVGSMDSSVYSVSQDYKATYSETGPGVDIYAPGTDIMSACSTTNRFSAPSYYANGSYKQTNISGTSMASPQVAGVAALLLQLNPGLTPTQVKQYLKTNCGTALYDTGNSGDWTNNRSLKGGSVKALFCGFDVNKNTQQEPMIASGNFQTFFPFQLQKR
jgi:subtilisin family serine protease